MTRIVIDPREQERLIAERQASGADRFDEVWEGTYVTAPIADDGHQEFQAQLVAVLQAVVGWSGDGLVRGGVNVSDRDQGWQFNFRCPDVVVFVKGTSAKNCGSHWFGGPDFAVEILSPGDRTPQKLPFYASVGVRELLVISRDPWRMERYRLRNEELICIGTSSPGSDETLESNVVPLTFRLFSNTAPRIEIVRRDLSQRWLL